MQVLVQQVPLQEEEESLVLHQPLVCLVPGGAGDEGGVELQLKWISRLWKLKLPVEEGKEEETGECLQP